MQKIGKFEIHSGKLRITDPCYDVDTWCAGEFPAMNGTWEAFIVMRDEGEWGNRVAELIVERQNILVTGFKKLLEVDVGVDSGQCGVFDAEEYARNQGGEYGDESTFYGKVCKLTHSEQDRSLYGGCLDFGAVSSSGYGDGSYEAFGQFNDKNELVSVRIVFLRDYDDEEEYHRQLDD